MAGQVGKSFKNNEHKTHMGEYAKHNGRDIKIGTCEDMYYLRADQANLVQPVRGSVNPMQDAGKIRFRFPFPDEDGVQPGCFEDYNRGVAVWGIEPPEEIHHYSVQFSSGNGLLTSLPCPEGKEGKASGHRIHYNGYAGKVRIVQQRLVEGQLVLICQCGSCGAAYRCSTIDDAQSVIDALLSKVEPNDARRKPFEEIARRIVAGYTAPNLWTPTAEFTTA